MLTSRRLNIFPALCIACCMLFSELRAQKGYNYEYGVMTGISNYLGEIGGMEKDGRGFISDLKLAKTRWNESVFFKYRFHPMFAFRMALNYLRIEGDDKLSTNIGRRYRNLNFRNDIFDAEGTVQWMFFNTNKPTGIYSRASIYLSAYVFTGIGVFTNNPTTVYQGSRIALRPLKTEGVDYSAFGICVPMGAGFYVTVNRHRRAHRFGIEFNWRYTNTDRLDDISSATWANPSTLTSATAAALNNRNPELGTNQPAGVSKNYGWYDDGHGNNINKAPRGNPKNKDSFISVNISYSVVMKGRFTRSRGKKIRSAKF